MKITKIGLTPKEAVAAYPMLTKAEGTLANWRNKKKGPRYYKVGSKILYRPADIETFLFQNPVQTIDSVKAGR